MVKAAWDVAPLQPVVDKAKLDDPGEGPSGMGRGSNFKTIIQHIISLLQDFSGWLARLEARWATAPGQQLETKTQVSGNEATEHASLGI